MWLIVASLLMILSEEDDLWGFEAAATVWPGIFAGIAPSSRNFKVLWMLLIMRLYCMLWWKMWGEGLKILECRQTVKYLPLWTLMSQVWCSFSLLFFSAQVLPFRLPMEETHLGHQFWINTLETMRQLSS